MLPSYQLVTYLITAIFTRVQGKAQQVIINSQIPTQITLQQTTQHIYISPYSLMTLTLVHQTHTEVHPCCTYKCLAVIADMLLRDAVFYIKQWTINDVYGCIICWCKARLVTMMWCERLFASIIDYHDLWLRIITSSSRPELQGSIRDPWVHEKYFAPSTLITIRPTMREREASIQKLFDCNILF